MLYQHDQQVGDLTLSPDEKVLVSGGYDGKLIAYDNVSNQELATVRAYPRNHVHRTAFSPDGRRLLTGCDCRIARMWNTRTWEKQFDITGFRDWTEGVAWSPDGKRYALGDMNIRVFSASSQQELKVLKGHEDALSNLAWAPNGNFLASIGLDMQLILWDMEKMEIAWKQEVHNEKPFALSWSPDSCHLVTGGKDSEARVWQVQSGNLVTKFKGHKNGIWRAKWSPDGKFVASTSGKELLFWEPFSGQAWIRINWPKGTIEALEWSKSGKHLWTGHQDGTVACWDLILDPDKLVQIARSRVVRPLTADERSDFGLPEAMAKVGGK